MLTDNPYNVLLFKSFTEIAALWQQLETTSENYAFQNIDWLKCWYDCVGTTVNYKMCLVAIESPTGQPIMILPLGIEKRHGVSCLTWLGGEVSDYNAPLLHPDYPATLAQAQFQALWQKIQAVLPPYDAILFEKMPQFIGGKTNPFLNLPCTPTASSAHFTNLGMPFDNFLKAKRSSKSIATEKRKHKHLNNLGRIEFVIAQDAEQIKSFLDAMVSQKTRSYLKMGVKNLFAQPGILSFFSKLSAQACPNGFVHLSALLLDGRIIATHWGLAYKNRFYHLYPTYEQSELAKYAPGGLLMWHLFQWCIDNNIAVYDFTIGDEPYKDQWCNQELKLLDCYLGRTMLGVCYAPALRSARRLKRHIKQSPALWKMAKKLRAALGAVSR